MAKVSLIVNGNPVTANVDPRTLLVQFLREHLRLTGTHVGCDTSQCGACVVHLDGKAVKSCTTLAVMADGHEVKTIEGLAADGAPLHPMQEAFREHHGLQCGFCTPGMIMTAVDIVHRKGHDLTDEVIYFLSALPLLHTIGLQDCKEVSEESATQFFRNNFEGTIHIASQIEHHPPLSTIKKLTNFKAKIIQRFKTSTTF